MENTKDIKIKVIKDMKMMNVKDIKPYFRNPRKNAQTVDALVKIIPVVGFNVPLVLDKDNVIVKGHSRYFAAFKLGMTELPVVYHDGDAETIKLDRLSDNRISEFSEWDWDSLQHEVDMVELDLDLSFLGFDFGDSTIGDNNDFDDMDFEFENQTQTVDKDDPKYAEYLAKQQEKFDKVEQKVHNHKENKEKFYKFVCSSCGEITYMRAKDVVYIDKEEDDEQ